NSYLIAENAVLRIPMSTPARYVSNPYGLQIIYSGAVLEVCMRKLVFYPEVVNFIEDEKDKFPSVKVQLFVGSVVDDII
ncbi:selenoprotein F, partial [Tanacetum coccineum]